MKLAKGIQTVGFRKWYERQLLQSHGHMALTFLCGVGVAAAMESLRGDRSSVDQPTSLATLAACTVTGIWALRRYLYLLQHAEMVANQAQCPACGTYGRLTLSPEASAPTDATPARTTEEGAEAMDPVDVCCRSCGHRWTIND